ncbi:MAG TPA: helix-turn-helix domain-containing protein [Luteimicrobium sp.]|jgi:AcrR family transcriptional regulator|nr:helix-turn-helix domain-containing protein [Luteimicrobium sp.]
MATPVAPSAGTQPRRSAAATRAEILRVALDLFTRQGYDGTSIRDIAEALGMTKSSLYYHFPGKEAIASALAERRGRELEELVRWIEEQPPGPGLLRDAALRWLASADAEQIRGMRFARANQPVMHRLAEEHAGIRQGFDRVVEALLPDGAGIRERLRVRMVFETLSAAILAAEGTDATDDDIIAAARDAVVAATS